MNSEMDVLSMTLPGDVLARLGQWIRLSRQRNDWTQSDLAQRSGVPAATISRLERTGLVASDSLFRIAFALRQLEAIDDFLRERLRLASLPVSLESPIPRQNIRRIRRRKEPT